MIQKNIDWQTFLEKSANLEEICSAFNLDVKDCETKEFNNDEGIFQYYNFFQDGFSLEFKDNIFTTVYLYGKYDKKYKLFEGSLPHHLTFEMDNSHIVGFLGEPNTKGGGHTVPISIQYETLGIDFTFISPVWELVPNYISFISLYKKNTDPENTICNLCRKKAISACGQCRLVHYCSVTCQRNHWKLHKSYCQKYYTTKN